MEKMTEDEVIDYMVKWLRQEGWRVTKIAKGRERGNDIEAQKGNDKLIIEAKGAKAAKGLGTKEKFSRKQIWTHFGVAVLKVLEEKHLNPNVKIGIVQPDDEDILDQLYYVLPEVKKFDITLFFINSNGNVRIG